VSVPSSPAPKQPPALNLHEQLILFGDLPTTERSRVPDNLDVSFLHKSFCIAGLPLRAPKVIAEPFTRNDDRFALTINPTAFMLPGGRKVQVGVPFGPKARLLAMWMATEVRDPLRRTGDCWLEIGRVMEWMRNIGIKPHTNNLNATKDQVVRLSFAKFTMIMKEGREGDMLFDQDQLIERGILDGEDMDRYAEGKIGQMSWPKGLKLSTRAYERFSQYSIPVPTSRIAKIAHSAMAIDTFVFLCYRLPLISSREEELVSWRQLIAQFGSGEAPSKFRETFEGSIKNALEAYPEAKVVLTNEGLRMRYSDPADLRRAFVSMPGGKLATPKRGRKDKDGAESLPARRPTSLV
jgi:hypothetical protein